MAEPDNVDLHLLREMREDMRRLNSKIDNLGGEVHSLRADVASDLLSLEKRVNDQFVALRRSVMEYHSTAVGHGLLYSELEERVRRLEARLDISAVEPR